jgi:hypothetical protein
MSVLKKILLSYSNTTHTDGGAAQLQRKVAIFCLAKTNYMRYLDTKISKIDYPGVNNLFITSSFEKQWNDLYIFPSSKKPYFSTSLEIPILEHDLWNWILSLTNYPRLLRTIMQLYLLRKKSDKLFLKIGGATKLKICIKLLFSRNFILKLSNVYPTSEVNIDSCYNYVKQISQNFVLRNTSDRLQVAVHVRRGDLLIRESDRILSDKYFTNLICCVNEIANKRNLTIDITIYTDCPRLPINMRAADHVTWEWSHTKNQLISITPSMYSWDYLREVSNARISILDDIESFKSLHYADILIASKSSYSYLPALFIDTKTIMPIFWHKGLASWLNVEPVEIENFENSICQKIENYLLTIFEKF